MDLSSSSIAARLAAAQGLSGTTANAAAATATGGGGGAGATSATDVPMPKTAAEARQLAAQFIAQMQQVASTIGADDGGDDDSGGDDDGLSLPALPTDAAALQAPYGTASGTSSALASISALVGQGGSGISAATMAKLSALTSSGSAQGNEVLAALSGTQAGAGAGALLNAPVATAAGPTSASAAENAKTVAGVAAQQGVDPVLAVAMMLVESGGNASAVGDGGSSFGLFQLHRGGMLTAAGLSPQQALDPSTNAGVAITSLAHTQRSMPAGSTPGQVAAASQRPADKVGYAAKVDASLARARALLGLPGA